MPSTSPNSSNINGNERFMISSFGRRRRRSSTATTDGNNRDNPTTSSSVNDTQDDDPYHELFQDDDQSVNDNYDEDENDHGIESNQLNTSADGGGDYRVFDLANGVEFGQRGGEDEKSNEEREERISNNDEYGTNNNTSENYYHNDNSNATLNGSQEDFSNFEEELGLNEAMLESLSEKLKALDNQIEIERLVYFEFVAIMTLWIGDDF